MTSARTWDEKTGSFKRPWSDGWCCLRWVFFPGFVILCFRCLCFCGAKRMFGNNDGHKQIYMYIWYLSWVSDVHWETWWKIWLSYWYVYCLHMFALLHWYLQKMACNLHRVWAARPGVGPLISLTAGRLLLFVPSCATGHKGQRCAGGCLKFCQNGGGNRRFYKLCFHLTGR